MTIRSVSQAAIRCAALTAACLLLTLAASAQEPKADVPEFVLLKHVTDARYYEKSVDFLADLRRVAITNWIARQFEIFDLFDDKPAEIFAWGGSTATCRYSSDGAQLAAEVEERGVALTALGPDHQWRFFKIPKLTQVIKLGFSDSSQILHGVFLLLRKEGSKGESPHRLSHETVAYRWDVREGKQLSQVTIPEGTRVEDISPDSKLCVIGSWDNHTLSLMSLETGKITRRFTHAGIARFIEDGKFLLVFAKDALTRIDVATGREIARVALPAKPWLPNGEGVAISPSGDLIAIAENEAGRGNQVTIRDGRAGEILTILESAPQGVDTAHVQFNRDGTVLFTSSYLFNYRDRYVGPSMKFWKIPGRFAKRP